MTLLMTFFVLIVSFSEVKEEKLMQARIRSVSIAALLGEAIIRIHNNHSVSSLFA